MFIRFKIIPFQMFIRFIVITNHTLQTFLTFLYNSLGNLINYKNEFYTNCHLFLSFYSNFILILILLIDLTLNIFIYLI